MTTPPSPTARAPSLAIWRLAWRNLWRQRRRTVLLLAVVAYATLAIIFFWGFTDGFVNSIIAGQARYSAAPVLVTSTRYHDDPDPSNALPALDLGELRSAPGVQAAAPRLEFPALLRSPYQALGTLVRGVDPGLEGAVSALPESVSEGRMLAGPGEIVLGAALADELDVRLGERLALDVQSLAGPQAAGLLVVGLIDSGIGAVDRTAALVELGDAQRLTGTETPTGIALAAPRGREQAVARALGARLPEGVRAYPVQELLGPLQEGLAAERAQMIPMGLIFSIFAAVTVMSTVVVSVLERTREFGVITALGLVQTRLAWMVTLEAVFTSALGFALGALLGYGLNLLLGAVNLLGPLITGVFGTFLDAFAVTREIYTSLSLSYLLFAAVTIVLAGLLAAWVPASRVRRLNAAEAMRSE